MLDIHFGVRREDVDAFTRLVEREFDDVHPVTKGDSYHTWEPFDAMLPEHEEHVMHMTIATLTPMVILNYLVNRLGVFLNPLEDIESAFHGRFIIVTDHDHWNQYFVELSYPE